MKTSQPSRPGTKTAKTGQYKSVEAFRKAKLREAVEDTRHIDWEKVLNKQSQHG